jgi:hypothetical protein
MAGAVVTIVWLLVAFLFLCMSITANVLDRFIPFTDRRDLDGFRSHSNGFSIELGPSSSPGFCSMPQPFQQAVLARGAPQMCSLKQSTTWCWFVYILPCVTCLFVVVAACYLVKVWQQWKEMKERNDRLRHLRATTFAQSLGRET